MAAVKTEEIMFRNTFKFVLKCLYFSEEKSHYTLLRGSQRGTEYQFSVIRRYSQYPFTLSALFILFAIRDYSLFGFSRHSFRADIFTWELGVSLGEVVLATTLCFHNFLTLCTGFSSFLKLGKTIAL